jgi:competence protein ComEA
MARRLALLLLAAATLLPAGLRRVPRAGSLSCEPEGRGVAPRHWIGCKGDAGARRDLDGLERVLLGRTVDLNRARAEDLAAVPGIGPGLAAEVVRDREERGPFRSPGELRRVRGIGPARMERARPWLAAEVP